MAKKIGSRKDRLVNNIIANEKEDNLLNSKLAALDLQKQREMVRWEAEKNKLSLPSLKANGRISLTPPSSPNTSPTRSPVLQRRRSDLIASETALRPHNQMIIISEGVCLRRSKSSQDIRLSVDLKPPPSPVCGRPGAVSPRLLHRRSTIARSRLNDEEIALRQASAGRRFSAGIVPSIHVEESAESLHEKVKRFNESLQKASKESNRSENSTSSIEDDSLPSGDLLVPLKPVAFRSKSLPNIFPMPGEKLHEDMTFYEDMKRCSKSHNWDPIMALVCSYHPNGARHIVRLN
ncbi:hypothetical protein AWC38_SpisGene14047 [Stylophora pistillata]|uniref:Uncharacterized protein n=1 Tax=Stylophora pistillata TaxID=50429 RepID=A0A2B4RWB4_STYPI|nr:hypothetical protein AWC38_SpisGene14047 [Stylophora pistillata]